MKIVTYNMLHNRRSTRNWSLIFDKYDPDIVLAQESLAPAAYRRPLLDESDWQGHVIWSPVNSTWGSAVYMKTKPPRQLELPDYRGWVVGVEVSGADWLPLQGRALRIFSLHAPTGKGEYATVVNSILDMVGKQRDGCDIVIGGDFNLTVSERQPSEERKNEKCNLEIQARLRDEFELINCWQTVNPGTPLAQTLRWTNAPSQPYHCDGIFVPAEWSAKLKSCELISGAEWDGMSDHNPVMVEFE
jgi:exonuclease III